MYSYFSCLALLSGCVGCLSCLLLSCIFVVARSNVFYTPPPHAVRIAAPHRFAVCLLAFRFACLPATPRLVLSWLPHVLSFFIVWVCWLLILSFLVLYFAFHNVFFIPPPHLPLTVPTAAPHGFAVCLLSFVCVYLPAKPRLVLSWLLLVLSCFVVCLCLSCFVVCWYCLALLSACVGCLCWLLVLSSPTLNMKPNP